LDFIPVLERDFTAALFAGDFFEDTLVAAAFAGAAFADLDAEAFFWVSVVFWAG